MDDTQAIPDDHARTAEKELLAAERHAACARHSRTCRPAASS
jgi:hypothetical protein